MKGVQKHCVASVMSTPPTPQQAVNALPLLVPMTDVAPGEYHRPANSLLLYGTSPANAGSDCKNRFISTQSSGGSDSYEYGNVLTYGWSIIPSYSEQLLPAGIFSTLRPLLMVHSGITGGG